MSALDQGLLVVDKPQGITSRDAVDRAQAWFPRRTRIGHAGTLDPLATGVLVLCVGAATRLMEYVQKMDKTYRAGIRLGVHSDTDDADGILQAVAIDQPPDRAAIAGILQSFIGTIEQIPPDYSAVHLEGRRAYELARQGKPAVIAPRPVQVFAIDVLEFAYPRLELEIRCGKGTYIRSLARDLGDRLGCGAIVETLRRMCVGVFDLRLAVSLESEPEAARRQLLPLAAAVAELPRITLPADERKRFCVGQSVPLAHDMPMTANAIEPIEAAVFDLDDHLVGIGLLSSQTRLLKPHKVLPAFST